MRKIVMTVLAGGSLLCGSLVAEAGILTGIRTVGSGLYANVEVAADASLTYAFFRKDATHWVIDLAKTEPGSVDPAIELGIPAATSLTAEKRLVGSVAITRLTIAVRPGVSMIVKSSADRKVLNLSFQSGMAPASAKEDDLLGDLDAPAKPTAKAAPAKDDLDLLLDTPVAAAAPAASAAGAKNDLASLDDDLDKPVAKPVVPPTKSNLTSLDKDLDDLDKPEAPLPVNTVKKPVAAADLDLALDEPVAPAPVKPVLVPVVPEKPVAVEPKRPLPKMEQALAAAAVVAAAPVAVPAGVDLGALTPDELGIASPELEAAIPVAKVEPKPAPKIEPKPQPAAIVASPVKEEMPVVADPVPEEKAIIAAPAAESVKPAKPAVDSKATGSLSVTDGVVEIVVDNFTTYKSFTLTEPTRFVIDFAGAKASLKAAAAKAKVPGVTAVRFSQYPDKVRIVFDLPKGDLPAYKVEKLDSGVRVLLK